MSAETKPRQRRRSKAEREADEVARRERVEAEEAAQRIAWSVAHGAPLTILDGWNPDTGTWAATSPVGKMLTFIGNGAHLPVAARLADVAAEGGGIGRMQSKGAEYAAATVNGRMELEPDVRVFADLHRQITVAEAWLEVSTVSGVQNKLRNDPELALKFLARRFPARWREQNAILIAEESDGTDAAITQAILDPNVALHLAKVAESVEAVRKDDPV